MDEKKKKCCICGREIEGWGNNPWGALDRENNIIEWNEGDECCNECDSLYVLSGRIYTLRNKKKEN